MNAATEAVVFSANLTQWNSGGTHSTSGDRVWWFDFSGTTAPGNYFVRDAEQSVVSPTFAINEDVYKDVLKQAFRTFFYQRAGFAKEEPYAEAAWADGASHLGNLQDSEARIYNDSDNAATEKDLSGGWYDAGDYNKYTNWTADYVIGLLHAYLENPAAWGDDFDLPESGNGVPDILDEIKWGLDSLIKMQNANGSVLSIVGLSHASPPSSASGQSLYGSESTSATLTTAGAFALGSTVFESLGEPSLATYADELQTRAESAWDWADTNPAVVFRNNDAAAGTSGLGAGQQEVDDGGREMKKLEAATYLFELTGESEYQTYFESNYEDAELIISTYSSAFRVHVTHFLLYYAALESVTEAVANNIQQKFVSAMNGGNVWGAVNSISDPYLAYLQDYTWGSSGIKANKGSMFYEQILYGLGTQTQAEIENTAAHYIHYLHGVNPLGKVYLSNMGDYGAENSVDQFYHTWFAHGNATWDSVTESTYGPAPGFLVGGPNPSYDWDSCCPNSCGGASNNAMCGLAQLEPPYSQPAQKSYTDFNNSWPLNSWSVTENSNGYQIRYLRLLSKYVQ